VSPPYAVTASISDDALELAVVGKEAEGLREDLLGQPPLEEILQSTELDPKELAAVEQEEEPDENGGVDVEMPGEQDSVG